MTISDGAQGLSRGTAEKHTSEEDAILRKKLEYYSVESRKRKESRREKMKEKENKPVKEDYDLRVRPSAWVVGTPKTDECIKTFFELLEKNHAGYIPNTIFLNFFYRIFKKHVERKDLTFFFEDGVPVVRRSSSYSETSSETFEQKVEASSFQLLYDRAIVAIRYDDTGYVLVYDGILVLVSLFKEYFRVGGILTNKSPQEVEYIFKGVEKYDEKIDNTKYMIAAYAPQIGITMMEQTLKSFDISIEDNYCDDIPYERMVDILSGDDKALLLFYGEPGTGKSTIIRKLIGEVEKRFILMDPSIITTISDLQFVSFLSENKNTVIVLEDCEKLLKSREDGINNTIGTILNLTDGIVGDSFGVKFICTFNSDIDNIDKALLRKGRLSMKYEFKKLPLEKAKKIYPEAVEDMTLADAYFAIEENDFSKEEKKNIGF